jgi:glycosyltransferase involved in cell wall biosynthesis
MSGIEVTSNREKPRHILFVPAADAAAYPPIIHAANLMAEAGWRVCVLSAPIAGTNLQFPRSPGIELRSIAARPSHVMRRAAYAAYAAATARLAIERRPNIVYASDPLGAGPGLLAARLSGARLVYHEHDTPAPRALHPFVARLRREAARRAAAVIFPNEARARIVQDEFGLPESRLHVLWNMPRRVELPLREEGPDEPLLLYYHGNVSPVLLPEIVVKAVRQFGGRVRLLIAGYEAPGAAGYINRLLRHCQPGPGSPVRYLGVFSRGELLGVAARAHVGLAVVPGNADDFNIRYLAGASNKAFDYMAAGLALLVSDLPDWRAIFVAPGYARSCDPADLASMTAALGWFIDHPEARREMGTRGRARIASEWNYDTAFRAVIRSVIRTPEISGNRPVRTDPETLADHVG